MICSSCHNEIPNGSAFCIYCGVPTNQRANQASYIDHAIISKPSHGRSKKPLMIILAIVLPIFFTVIVILFLFAPGKQRSFTLGESGGTVDFGEIELTYEPRVIENTLKIRIEEIKDYELLPAIPRTKVYHLNYSSAGNEPVTVKLKLNDDVTSERLMLCLGFRKTSFDGKDADYLCRFVEAAIEDDYLIATFTPSDFLQTDGEETSGLNIGYSALVKPAILTATSRSLIYFDIEKSGFTLLGTAVYTASYSNGHFKLKMPETHSGGSGVTKEDAQALLDYLEKQYDYFLSIGFRYDRRKTNWPFEVIMTNSSERTCYYIENSNAVFGRNPEKSSIQISHALLSGGYDANKKDIEAALTHEWFHFVQANYTAGARQKTWVDDATATYFEIRANKGVTDNFLRNWSKNFEGIFPKTVLELNEESMLTNARHGYGRASLINYLNAIYGQNPENSDYILNLYKNTANRKTDFTEALIISSSAERAQLSVNYYRYLLAGCVFDSQAYSGKNYFSTGNNYNCRHAYGQISGKLAGSETLGVNLAVKALTKQNLSDIQAGKPAEIGKVVLPSAIKSYDGKLVAITFDKAAAKTFGDQMTITLETKSTEKIKAFLYVMPALSAANSSISVLPFDEKGIIKIPKIKEQVLANTKYLVLIISQSDSPAPLELVAKIEACPTLEEMVGAYSNGKLIMGDVIIKDKVYRELESKKNIKIEEWQTVVNGQASKGTTKDISLEIIKTGNDQGTMKWGTDTIKIDLPFSYVSGQMSFSKTKISTDVSIQGTLTASFDINNNIVISGQLKNTINHGYLISDPENFCQMIQFSGIKNKVVP